MGEFVIEYCGEVISCDEARLRSQKYELEGLQDAYIISLSGAEFIDATKKGSLGRFINHSCDPNCETRKWTVLGEVRVGIFAKQDIKAGTELTYNYNFEWYGGAKVRCRCGAASCVGFLGAKSRGFQEDTYVWDDNDDRFSVENVPLYDSEDDEPLSNLVKQSEVCVKLKVTGSKSEGSTQPSQSAGEDNAEIVQVKNMLEVVSVDIQGNDNRQKVDLHMGVQEEKVTSRLVDELIKEELSLTDMVQEKLLKGERNEDRGGKKRKQAASSIDVRKRMGTEKLTLSHRKLRLYLNQNPNNVITSHVKAHDIYQYLSSKRACEELLAAEEAEAAASMELSRLHEKLRPSMEDLGKDAPDNLPLSTAEEWIALTCKQMMTVFDFNYKAIRSLPCFSSGLLDREPVLN